MTRSAGFLDQLTAEDRDWFDAVTMARSLPPVPHGTELLEILGDLGVPHAELDEILRLRPRLGDHDQLRSVVDRLLTVLVEGIGAPTGPARLPDLSRCDDVLARYAYVFAYAACHPLTRQWHRDHGIPDAISRRTLADLGRQLTHQRRRGGRSGLGLNTHWLAHHFQGRLYQLGRLQFELAGLGRTTSAEIRAAGTEIEPGAPALLVHVPDYCGPIDPASCAESFAAARAFFPRYFPDHAPVVAACYSWLLDPQLGDYLPNDSNILAFQRLFMINQRRTAVDDAGAFEFVFGTRDITNRDRLSRRTSLQRALIDHLDNGRHWYGGVGWRPFP